MIASKIAKTGENITVSRFSRFKLGDRDEPAGPAGLIGAAVPLRPHPA